jgi:hypothetical protein
MSGPVDPAGLDADTLAHLLAIARQREADGNSRPGTAWQEEMDELAARSDPATNEAWERLYGPALLLDDLAAFLLDYVAFPSVEAAHAVALWAAHTHFVAHFETTPRLNVASPEKQSGKTRLLEVLELVCARPRAAVNTSTAAMFRLVQSVCPTLLFDEADTYFGPRAKDHEELRGLINAGHRRGQKAWRCVGDPKKMEVQEFPAFCPVALAGIGDLPDTIADRSVLIRMRRRRRDERILPFRRRHVGPQGAALCERLATWATIDGERAGVAEPELPDAMSDRAHDVWEPLVILADLAGEHWPVQARRAALRLDGERQRADGSLGVRLLTDIRDVLDADRLPTVTLLERLTALDESPWGNLRGKPLDARGLARRLGRYDIGPKDIRTAAAVVKGYERGDFLDLWDRYVIRPAGVAPGSATSATSATTQADGAPGVAAVADVALPGQRQAGGDTEGDR